MQKRKIIQVVNAIRTLEGGGFPVRRPFPIAGLLDVDPFLLLDHLGPVNWGPGEGIGAPDHPHRGFETVTYLLSGEIEHKDSAGHSGKLAPGDVQWMTAGSGVVHSELPSESFMRDGGTMHGFQVWINLPAKDKMISPRYQEIPASDIPVAHDEDGLVSVRVIAGKALGIEAVIDTHTPIIYLHYTLHPGGSVEQEIPSDHNALVYVVSGEATLGINKKKLSEGQLGTMSTGDSLLLKNADNASQPVELLILAGIPIGESLVRHGPFVMNTDEEIRQAIDDYRTGKMGTIEQ